MQNTDASMSPIEIVMLLADSVGSTNTLANENGCTDLIGFVDEHERQQHSKKM